MAKIVLYDFKTAKEVWFDELKDVYLKKIKPYAQFEIVHLKTIHADRDQVELKIKHEEKTLLDKITSDDFIFLFDVKGKALTSFQFSEALSKAQQSGKKRIVLIVGGAYGVSEKVKSKAHMCLTLGGMTMNHLVAEAVILEQLYRAYTIMNRIPYHNE